MTVRTWGRERLRTLARLIPACRAIDVHLAGFGLPSIYVLDLGPVQFTLALSGWTDNDWTAGAAKFDLLTRRLDVSPDELTRVYEAMRTLRRGSDARGGAGGRARRRDGPERPLLALPGRPGDVRPGRRGLSPSRPLPRAPSRPRRRPRPSSPPPRRQHPEEASAKLIFAEGDVRIIARRPVSTGYKLSGSAGGRTGLACGPSCTRTTRDASSKVRARVDSTRSTS